MTVTIESIVKRWTDPDARPLFKGKLIDESGCCCAQGDVLRCSGWTDAQLREMSQTAADFEVSKILGISRAHAILLRNVNDSESGCPQDVLTNPEKILGPNARLVLEFWKHIDTLSDDQWDDITAAWNANWDTARNAAWGAGWNAAKNAAWDADWESAWDATWSPAWNAAGSAAGNVAGNAAIECVGISHLAEPSFLKFFFPDVSAWLASINNYKPPEGAGRD